MLRVVYSSQFFVRFSICVFFSIFQTGPLVIFPQKSWFFGENWAKKTHKGRRKKKFRPLFFFFILLLWENWMKWCRKSKAGLLIDIDLKYVIVCNYNAMSWLRGNEFKWTLSHKGEKMTHTTLRPCVFLNFFCFGF